MKTTTFKDGHMFVLNIIDPMDPKDEAELVELLNSPEMPEKMQENSEKADMESPEKQSSHGRFLIFSVYFYHFYICCLILIKFKKKYEEYTSRFWSGHTKDFKKIVQKASIVNSVKIKVVRLYVRSQGEGRHFTRIPPVFLENTQDNQRYSSMSPFQGANKQFILKLKFKLTFPHTFDIVVRVYFLQLTTILPTRLLSTLQTC